MPRTLPLFVPTLAMTLLSIGCGDAGPGGGPGGGPDPNTMCDIIPGDLPTWRGTLPLYRDTRSSNYGYDVLGLPTAIEAAQAISGPPWEIAFDDMIYDAVVLFVGHEPGPGGALTFMTVADGTHVMMVEMPDADTVFDPEPLPGDRIDLHVLSVALDQGFPKITQITDWGPDSISTTNVSIYVQSSTGWELTADNPDDYGLLLSDVLWTHHIYGDVVSDGVTCGDGFTCFTLRHGPPEDIQYDVELRVPDSLGVERGDCLELYAPMTAVDGVPRFDITNPDWARTYERTPI